MKKAKGTKAGKKSGKKAVKRAAGKTAKKGKAVDIRKVRQSISNIVGKEAEKITKAVVGVAEAGQLASAKYLFEVAGVYPTAEAAGEETASESEDETLAKILLGKIEPAASEGNPGSGGEGAQPEATAAPGGEGDPEQVDFME